MKIKTLTLGLYQTNTYLLADDDGTCVIIDPGYEAERILSAAEDLKIGAILLTHGHFDHVGAVRPIAEQTGCKVYIHAGEAALPMVMTQECIYFTDHYDDGDIVRVGSMEFKVLHTPGHTPGSVCLQCGKLLFSGDTLFEGSCGRTDFPASSPSDMRKSLKRLSDIDDDLTVYPGHGPKTTLTTERRTNPFLRSFV
ncbi:MAG: MBL fold metallo-hydrolase [Ruminococcaceae bacterium]|nr:MBL fold metallo-hydrolase [Oscillospiraceae bacterium]